MGNPGEVVAQSGGFRLDHLFTAVGNSSTEMTALAEAGFHEGPAREHPGQGTASRGIFFENAYLEFIWLTDAGEANSPQIRRTRLADRVAGDSEACPFGVSLRREAGTLEPHPFPTWDYAPPYVPEGTAIPVGTNSNRLDEPLLFLLPWRTEPGWPLPSHPNGTRRITATSITLTDTSRISPELRSLVGLDVVKLALGAFYLMEVELDDGAAGQRLDLRPGIPLIILW